METFWDKSVVTRGLTHVTILCKKCLKNVQALRTVTNFLGTQ